MWAESGHQVSGQSGGHTAAPASASDSGLTRHHLSRRIGMDDLVATLRPLLRRGLPVDLRRAGELLPNLRSVVARSVHPTDAMSRVDALNELLIRFVANLDHDRYGQPARILFGVAPGMSGTTLTVRRQHAADHLGYDLDHFRKRVEPEVLRAVAELIYRDLLRYKKRLVGGAGELVEAATFTIRPEDMTAEQELTSRVWAAVYALRAELIGLGRLASQPGYETAADIHRAAARERVDELHEVLAAYRRTYGAIIRHGNLEYRVEALERLVVIEDRSDVSEGCDD
jgi:hypothetical protein